MKVVFKFVITLVVLLVLYFSFWPVSVSPQAWQAPPPVPLEGDYAANDLLSDLQAIPLDGLHGPEAVIDDGNGTAYTATHDGWVLRWEAETVSPIPERWVDLGGRPLGMAFDADGSLWVANAYTGLQKVTPTGDVTLELESVDGVRLGFADDLDITSSGIIYLSDASTKFSPVEFGGTLEASLLDVNEQGMHGRVIEYSIATGEARVVMDGLTFANGVAISEDESFFYVAETGKYRLWRYWLSGENAGQSEVVIDNMPGFPDNIHTGRDGRFWLGFTSPRSEPLDALAAYPALRKAMQRLPASVRPNVQVYAHIVIIDSAGQIVRSFQDPNKQYETSTGAWETDNYVYVGSLTAPVLARYTKAQLGL